MSGRIARQVSKKSGNGRSMTPCGLVSPPKRNPDRMESLSGFELRSVPILNSAWMPGGSQCWWRAMPKPGQMLVQQHRPRWRMAPAFDLEIRALDCGSVTHSIPIIHWPRHGILRNVNDGGGIQHLGLKGLKESVSCIYEQAINPAVCRSDFQLVPPMWSRAALARVANCWCPRVMWRCPEDGASISRPTPTCPAMGGPA